MSQPITEEELAEWRSMDLTQRAFGLIREGLSLWDKQSCQGPTADDSHRLAAYRDGYRNGLQFVLDLGVRDEPTGGT